jgi:copper chaperone CopZ
MLHTISVSYLPCQICHAKVNCKECEVRLEEALLRIQGVDGASVQMAVKQVQIDSSLNADTLEEALEDVGLFAE